MSAIAVWPCRGCGRVPRRSSSLSFDQYYCDTGGCPIANCSPVDLVTWNHVLGSYSEPAREKELKLLALYEAFRAYEDIQGGAWHRLSDAARDVAALVPEEGDPYHHAINRDPAYRVAPRELCKECDLPLETKVGRYCVSCGRIHGGA